MPSDAPRPARTAGVVPDAHGRPAEATGAQRLALRVVQAGAVAVVLAAATYKVFELDRFFIPKELTLHLTALLAGLLALAAARRAEPTRGDLAFAGFLALSAASAALAQNPWAGTRALAVSVSGLVLFWTARALARAGLGRPLLVALAVAAVVGCGTALAQAYGVRVDLFSLNRAPGGTLGNRNFVAHLAAFTLPVLLLAGLRAWRGFGVILCGAGVAASAATLVLTRSRAAWLAVIAVLAVLVVGWLLVAPLRRHGRSWLRLALLMVFAGGGVAAALLLPNSLRWKSDNPYADTATGMVNYQEGSGRGRLIQWRNSVEMAVAHPLLGVGPGNWPVAYPRYAGPRDPSMDRGEPGTTSNPWPSSDWVAMLAERGFPAFVLLMLGFLGLAGTAWRGMRTARDADEGLAALALLGTLAAVAVVGAFDAVLLLGLPTLLVWASLGALSAGAQGRWEMRVSAPMRLAGIVLLLVAGGAAAVRSGAQVGAMAVFDGGGGREAYDRAARLDPGSYRIRLRAAQANTGRRNCEARREHARAARALLPEAQAAKAIRTTCGTRR
jgi:O-antigen ligase